MTDSTKGRSDCHNATVTIGGDDREGTHYYVCSKCSYPCDLIVTPQFAHSDSTNDWLDEIFENHKSLCSIEDGPVCTHCREAKQAINQKLIEARIDELTKLHRHDGKDFDTEIDEIIDQRIEALQAQAPVTLSDIEQKLIEGRIEAYKQALYDVGYGFAPIKEIPSVEERLVKYKAQAHKEKT